LNSSISPIKSTYMNYVK